MNGKELEDLVVALAQRVDRLEGIVLRMLNREDVGPELPELELQHRRFVEQLREHREG